jgi:hypothetical protein
VTLGIPRLREIVMTASTKPKTPSMTMAVNEGVSSADIGKFCKKASRLTLSQVVNNVMVKERLAVSGSGRSKEFTIAISFFPQEEYRSEYDVNSSEILGAFAVKFPLILRKELQVELKRLDVDLKNQMVALGIGKAAKGTAGKGGEEGGDDDEDDTLAPRGGGDDTSEVGDGDAEDAKRSRQKKEQASYESDDEDGELDDVDASAKPPNDGVNVNEDDADDVAGNQDGQPKPGAEVESLFLKHCPFATSFKFNSEGCKITLSVSCISRFAGIPELDNLLVCLNNAKTTACRYCGEDLPKDCCARDSWNN